jgi:phage N-6-adenine-methyltransferase
MRLGSLKIHARVTPGHASPLGGEARQWATPQRCFDELQAEFGFTLDACASADNAKCERYFTAKDDGLAQDWS